MNYRPLAIIDLQISKIKQFTVIYDSKARSSVLYSTLASVTLHLGDPVQKKIMPPKQTFNRATGTGTLTHILTKHFKALLVPAAVHFQASQISMESLSLCFLSSSQ